MPLSKSLTLKDAIELVLANNGFGNVDLEKAKVIVQGVSPPLNGPAQEISQELCAHDLFLYIVVGI